MIMSKRQRSLRIGLLRIRLRRQSAAGAADQGEKRKQGGAVGNGRRPSVGDHLLVSLRLVLRQPLVRMRDAGERPTLLAREADRVHRSALHVGLDDEDAVGESALYPVALG